MGIIRSVRAIVREFLNFGNEEVTQLKHQLEKQRAQLQQLKLVREQRQQQEEKIALMELRRAVQQMQGVVQQRTSQEEAVVEAVDKLSDKMQKIMENDMQTKAAGLMQSIDYQQVLTGDGGLSGAVDNSKGTSIDTTSGVESSIPVTTPQKPRNKSGSSSRGGGKKPS